MSVGLLVALLAAGSLVPGARSASSRALGSSVNPVIHPLPLASPSPIGAARMLRLPGTGGSGTYSNRPSLGAQMSIPSVGLHLEVADYDDCSGVSPMTRAHCRAIQLHPR